MDRIETLEAVWRAIAPSDYEEHMARVGQAQANAEHLAAWAATLPEGALIIPGAGPGQMFDYISAEVLGRREVVFTDINAAFRQSLERRLERMGRSSWRVVEDDIEATQVAGPIPFAALLLVLENVDWRKALDSLGAWQCRRVLIVQQENPPAFASSMTPGLALPGTMNLLRENARPHLIDRGEVHLAMTALGYAREREKETPVLDGKRMCAAWYRAGEP